jgi:hypothetical protein
VPGGRIPYEVGEACVGSLLTLMACKVKARAVIVSNGGFNRVSEYSGAKYSLVSLNGGDM